MSLLRHYEPDELREAAQRMRISERTVTLICLGYSEQEAERICAETGGLEQLTRFPTVPA